MTDQVAFQFAQLTGIPLPMILSFTPNSPTSVEGMRQSLIRQRDSLKAGAAASLGNTGLLAVQGYQAANSVLTTGTAIIPAGSISFPGVAIPGAAAIQGGMAFDPHPQIGAFGGAGGASNTTGGSGKNVVLIGAAVLAVVVLLVVAS